MSGQRRPQDGAPRVPARGMSAEYITGELSPTAQRILAAAQRVLQRDGYSGVTLQRVGAEAGEHKSLVIYHFGNKATLMWMLVDSLWHDLDVELFQSVETLPEHSERRISALIDSQRRLGHLTTQQQMYLDLFPSLTRRGETRRHLGELNRSYRDLHQRFLSATGLQEDELLALAGLVLAIGDGMAVSLLVRPADIDDLSAYRLLEAMVLSLADGARREAGTTPVAGAGRPPSRPRAPNGGSLVGPDPLRDLAPVARKLVRGARRTPG
jgi:AcrR family transcriptional regulator